MNKKVAIYLRLSQEDKDKQNSLDDSESIKNQRNMLLDYINKHSDLTLVDEYCDEDLSGAGTYRPEFERLIKDCENKKIDIVLCKSQSRFSRDMEIVEKYINNKFIEWNIRFIGLSDNADTEIIGNKKSRQINGLVNEWYLEDVSNNIRSALKSKMKQGEFISPFAVFGYEISKNNNNKLIPDQIAKQIVKNIFNLYLNGLGYSGIANYLNIKNIPSPSLYKYQKGIKLNIISNKPREEIKWNPNAIKSILTNEIYIGNLIQGKRTTISYKNHKIINNKKEKWIKVENTHEAIIDKETFNKVQKLIKQNTRPLKKTGKIHLLSGKIYCKECNHIMRKKDSSKHTYLVCCNKCNNKKSIRYDKLTDLLLIEINKKINQYYNYKILKKLLNKQIETKNINEIKSLEIKEQKINNQISKISNYLQNIYEDKINNIITKEQFKCLLKNYDNNNKILKKEKILIEEKLKTIKENKNNYQKEIKTYKHINKLNKYIIEEFIDKVFIEKISKNKRNIEIKWNF